MFRTVDFDHPLNFGRLKKCLKKMGARPVYDIQCSDDGRAVVELSVNASLFSHSSSRSHFSSQDAPARLVQVLFSASDDGPLLCQNVGEAKVVAGYLLLWELMVSTCSCRSRYHGRCVATLHIVFLIVFAPSLLILHVQTDTLRRDPLHCKTSEKISDQAKCGCDVAASANKKLHFGFNETLCEKDADGQECCFEEARMQDRYFEIVSPASSSAEEEDDVTMEEVEAEASEVADAPDISMESVEAGDGVEAITAAEEATAALLRDLTEDEAATVREAIYGIGRPDDVIATSDTDSVQRQSLHKLQPGVWLNDEVIHYFLLMLARRDEELAAKAGGGGGGEKRKRCHFFKSFFITKLLDEAGGYNYKNVKWWSKNVPGKDIFALDKIFCPSKFVQLCSFYVILCPLRNVTTPSY